MRLVLLGLPGAGKGTVAETLVATYGAAHVSSGDLLRAAVADGTDLGVKAKAFMDAGDLVPDDLVVAMVVERLAADDCRAGFLLDGFPRTEVQAEALDAALAEHDASLDGVLYLAVDAEVVIGRLTARRTCADCGRVYNVVTLKPAVEGVCDACSGRLIVRPDDEPETVRQRIEVYGRQTMSLVTYYDDRGLLIRVDADTTVDAVRSAAVAAVAGLASAG